MRGSCTGFKWQEAGLIHQELSTQSQPNLQHSTAGEERYTASTRVNSLQFSSVAGKPKSQGVEGLLVPGMRKACSRSTLSR
jgi:hypothetical protein